MTLIELSHSRRIRFLAGSIITFFASVPTGHAADACPGQDVASHQTVVGFNSLTDGQPGAPRVPQLTVAPSYDFEEREFQGQFMVSGVVATSGFWCQAQFALSAPTLDAGEGLIDFEKSVTASWQQRWRIDDGSLPTLSTVVSVQMAYDEPGEKNDIIFTGIVAKSIQWGAVYLNAFAESAGGAEFSAVDYGGVVGAKRILNDKLALIADTAIPEGGAYALELSVERDFKNGLSLGPGIALSRGGDGSDGIDVAIGIVIFKKFSG